MTQLRYIDPLVRRKRRAADRYADNIKLQDFFDHGHPLIGSKHHYRIIFFQMRQHFQYLIKEFNAAFLINKFPALFLAQKVDEFDSAIFGNAADFIFITDGKAYEREAASFSNGADTFQVRYKSALDAEGCRHFLLRSSGGTAVKDFRERGGDFVPRYYLVSHPDQLQMRTSFVYKPVYKLSISKKGCP